VSVFVFMPPAASAYASQIDTLLWTITAVAGAVALGVFVLLIKFSVQYRRAAGEGLAPADSPPRQRQRALEITWITLPLLIFLAFFVWAARLYFQYERPPGQPLELYVVAKQWMWKLEHPNGRREINELHVPRGRAIKLVMTSQDVIHSFYVPAFRVKRDVVPGRFAILWFTPDRTGEYRLFCAEYCGTDHSRMDGRVVVMEPNAYARWLSAGTPQPSLVSLGQAKFRSYGCSGCHEGNTVIHAPQLEGLYGRVIPLADGRFVRVDEQYLRDSILLPARDIAAGYADDMPSFAGQVSEQDLLELIAYIKSLATQGATAGSEAR
jgi:cytochrome c oxidase subunit 2